MRNEKRTHQVVEPHEVADWTLQFIGGAWMACHLDTGDAGRNARAQWVGRQLLQLGRAIRALAVVAAKHPEEFRAALGEPVQIELAEFLRCESRAQRLGQLIQCELQRHETGEHTNGQLRWTSAEAVPR